MTNRPRRIDLTLLAILLLALALRLLLWSQPLHKPANDEIEYIAVARDLLAGRGWVFYDSWRWLRAPLYPLFLAASLWLSGGDLQRAALPNIAVSALNVYLSYALALRLFGRRAALLAALLTALLWTNATFASLSMAETLFAALWQAGVLLLLRLCSQLREPGGGALRAAVATAIGAGVVFGLAALTRSLVLPFVAVAALWIIFLTQSRKGAKAGSRAALGCVAALLTACALTIAPWTLRNTLAYGAPIVIETGLSYNTWVFNEPRESRDAIHRALKAIPNPAARADYATARGTARLREDPAILARKIWPNLVFLLRVKPIQDRFLQADYSASLPLPIFAAALVFDDVLYVVIALAAIWGLRQHGSVFFAATVRRSRAVAGVRRAAATADTTGDTADGAGEAPDAPGIGVALLLLWVGFVVGSLLLTHGEMRYRHFLFPALIPLAAAALTRPVAARRPSAANRGWWIVSAALALVFLWAVGTSYPWGWAAANTARGAYWAIADAQRVFGDAPGALASDERAAVADDAPDAWIRVADGRAALGNSGGALEAYAKAARRNTLYVPAALRLGDALRRAGREREAKNAFDAPFLDQQEMTDVGYTLLRPPPRATLDIGDGLDLGYVAGVYPAEAIDGSAARWSDGAATLRLASATDAPFPIRLRLSAPRPDGRAVRMTVCSGGRCDSFSVGGGWRELTLLAYGGELTIRSETYTAPDGRRLGVLLDSAAVIGGPSVP